MYAYFTLIECIQREMMACTILNVKGNPPLFSVRALLVWRSDQIRT